MTGIMQQEEERNLAVQLRQAWSENKTLQADRDRFEALWRKERDWAAQLDAAYEEAERKAKSLEKKLVDFRNVSGRVAGAEKERDEAQKKLAKMGRELVETVAALEEARDELDGARVALLDAKQKAGRLDAEIGPFRSLIAAMKAEKAAQATIADELGKLDS